MTHVPYAAVLHGAGDLRWEPRPLDERLPSDGVRIALGAAGICGSDLHYFRHGRSGDFVMRSPLVMGHELAGTVVAVGEHVADVALGDRVAVNPARTCGVCPRCREGRSNLCERVSFMGSASKVPHMQGGFAEVFDVAAEQCVVVPSATPMVAVALTEPLAVALHAARRAREIAGANVVVFGGGPIGLLLALVVRRAGAASVAVVDVSDAPLAAARRLDVDTVVNSATDSAALRGLYGADVVFEASGTAAGLADALTTVRRGGCLVQVGNLSTDRVTAPLNLVMSKELDVAGSFRFDAEFGDAARLIADQAIPVDGIVSGRLPLSRVAEAFELAMDRTRSVKVALVG